MSLAVAVAVIATTAACSGGDGEADPTTAPTTSAASTTSVARTTDPTTTTSTTPPTDPTTTTTTTSPTTQPATSTIATTSPDGSAPPATSAAELAAAIEAGWRESVRLYIEALMDPTDEAAGFAAARYRSGDSLFEIGFRLVEMGEANQRIRPEPLAEPTLTLEAGPVPADDGSGDYIITICEVDPWVLVEDVDGTETVINDGVASGRFEVRMKLIEDRWTINQSKAIEVFEGPACGPA